MKIIYVLDYVTLKPVSLSTSDFPFSEYHHTLRMEDENEKI